MRLLSSLAMLFIVFSLGKVCGEIPSATGTPTHCETHEDPNDYIWDSNQVTDIFLNADSISVIGTGVRVDGCVAEIRSSGTYRISGLLEDGQVVVNSDEDGIVRLIFNGVDIRSSSTAPVYIKDADKAFIVLKEDTQNYVQDGRSDISKPDEPNAVIFSKDDFTLWGTGSLTVTADVNDGIVSKDGLIIAGGVIDINAVDDGIRGKDYLVVRDANIVLWAAGDGLKSDNDANDMGYISIESGVIEIESGGDAIAAETDVMVVAGQLALLSGGGCYSQVVDSNSTKGIKAGRDVLISGGSFLIDSSDDAIHSDGDLQINGGTLILSTDDDGIHADSDLVINGGDINILRCYEGIESADGDITLNDGTIQVLSSDDGVNVAGGGDQFGGGGPGGGFPGGGGRPGRGLPTGSNCTFYMHGGYLVVESVGDGIDINGSMVMTGGVLLIQGPTMDMNGALDYDRFFQITGGYLLAAGSSGMAQAPGTNSTQNSVLITFNTALGAGTLVHMESNTGQEIFTFAPSKRFESIAFSSLDLAQGTSYKLYYGGSSTGTKTDGLYQGGTYTPGTQYSSFTISNTVTTIGGGGAMVGPVNPGR